MESHLNLSSWNDLPAAAGIQALTGEACAFSLRLLCDVNQEGLDLLQDYFGVPELTLAPAWNSAVNGSPAIGSVMLSRELFAPLAEFVLARKKALAVLYVNDRIHAGLFDADTVTAYENANLASHKLRRLYQPDPQASFGSRNVHQMSGRTM